MSESLTSIESGFQAMMLLAGAARGQVIPYAKVFDAERESICKAVGFYPRSIKMLSKPVPIEVTGVRFFDQPNHNGKGHAKNEVEIHPICRIIFP